MRHSGVRPVRATVAGLLASAAVWALGACGGDGRTSAQAQATAVAQQFVRTVSVDTATACLMLAPRTHDEVVHDADGRPCTAVLAQQWSEQGPTGPVPESGHAQVAGHAAWVTLGDQVVVLSLFGDTWLVTAAGCRPTSEDPAVPYDCVIDGG